MILALTLIIMLQNIKLTVRHLVVSIEIAEKLNLTLFILFSLVKFWLKNLLVLAL